MEDRKTVAIIGAGLSGLIACKYMLSKGYTPIVFESKSQLGGVWTHTAGTTKLQSAKQAYMFSDYPWPATVETDYPNSVQVLAYIESYAEHFGLLRFIRFSTKVVSVAYCGVDEDEIMAWSEWGGTGHGFSEKGMWNVTAEHGLSNASEVHQVDFVIMAVGRFSDIPNIPKFTRNQGPEAFEGQVIHSKDYMNMDNDKAAEFVKGKRVTIIGILKSALDIAAECSSINGNEKPCTMVYRTGHWILPDFAPWGVPLPLLYFNRFAEYLVHKPGQGLLLRLISTALSPLRWSITKLVESYAKWKLPLDKYGLVPNRNFLEDLSSCKIAMAPDNFLTSVETGSIVLKKTSAFRFCNEGIIADENEVPIKSDLVIFATGFNGEQKLKETFTSRYFQEVITGPTSAIVPLYRQCVHPRIPQLAVIGFSESISNLHTSEMRCKWVAELLDGAFKLPSVAEMEKEIEEWDEYMKKYSGPYFRRSCIAGLSIWHNDQLCKDMGMNPKRKKGFLAEVFEPYSPLDYIPS